ncbi:MAG: ABC transporter ATP-binding protein [Candidatus Accumulibacter phosphatis]|jgi:tungstate transport system ATP-binding protein|uniref:Cell division ATP-binding protein FtsE n=2 Tax=Candidatus Accumulibacter TaxID=327159 RepID=A0A080M6Z0_9PROT|nr:MULTISPECIES: ABC transporter ATP-binding protein [Candidatus Accumulibacter]KFB72884.1 MAG: Cell division ATP-binding protein FtsE [Candidatus Accumulibacter phosphatis]NMQ04559.1 ABC transporter ATP-binding protein [Candidatus Accumulibacter contiguus]HRF11895.1 ABC transporter ATP-binding protein [Candidatus Accumulibacter phosphatis]
MSLLGVTTLTKSFAARRLFSIDTLTLQTGESYVLTGENGSGKSTLLRILAGIEVPDSGLGHYQDRCFNWQPYPDWLRREVIYVHQQPYLFHTSVADNIAYGLRVRGVEANQRQRLVAAAIAWARLTHLLATPPQKLSGGERQRVALARAWVLKPKVLLLDEPTANLDAESRRQTIDLLRGFCAARTTAVIACHDRDLIELPDMRRLDLASGQLCVGSFGIVSSSTSPSMACESTTRCR